MHEHKHTHSHLTFPDKHGTLLTSYTEKLFCRTSAGKSLTVGSIIGSNIMPAGKGHTTDKIVSVYGGDEKKLLVTTDKEEYEVLHN